MTDTTENNQAEVVEPSTNQTAAETDNKDDGPEIFSRIFYTILFFLVGWVSLWVFSFVVLIQFGFLLITGQVNSNLKGFNREVGLFLFDLIKYLSFQTDEKPFPFKDWPYDNKSKNQNKSELNDASVVKVNK